MKKIVKLLDRFEEELKVVREEKNFMFSDIFLNHMTKV